ncbi:putative ionotropic receptor IR4 [Operophtera brumata]|uniref:Putative ionotropic receptor IR4 n=1 Tax=Operophtera brumata TaxID=104452 RepID=A0A0L7LP65_OPEBR|nr:putative ionotropic receptor IR4 [Operophtera brumata]
MYVEPFTAGVWWSCLAIGCILAVAQRVSSRSQEEKDGSYCAVLATWLQQGDCVLSETRASCSYRVFVDAGAVPNGISGRWTFIVMSVCSMLVHAYYTSAIVKTNWNDLEYLKKKKMTSSFYQELERGVDLIREGNTAFHSEYNQIFPHFKTFTDDQICKLQHVDTIPLSMTWIMTTVNGQWTSSFRSVSTWILEVGLAKRLQSRLLALRPPCRSALLAERVNFGDVAPLLALTVTGAILSLILLGIEILFDKWKNGSNMEIVDVKTLVSDVEEIPM